MPFYDATSDVHQQLIVSDLEKGSFDLVIIDNLATASDGLRDKNDAVNDAPLCHAIPTQQQVLYRRRRREPP